MGRSNFIYRNTPNSLLFHIGAVFTVVVWGIAFVSTKVLQENGLVPVEVYIYRFIIAYLLLLIISHNRLWANTWRDEFLFFICGLCGGSLYFIAENTAIEYTLVSNVSLITSTAPLLTVFLIGFVYKSERPGRGIIIGSLIAFAGVACVIFNSSFAISLNPIGDFLALSAAVSWAVYSLVLRRLNAMYSVMFISRKTFFYGILSAVPFLLMEDNIASPTILLQSDIWPHLLFLGMVCSMLAFVIWAIVVKGLGAVKASNYLYLSPIVTLVSSYFILNEQIGLIGTIGCGLILLGMWLGDYLSLKKQN